ncbi:TraB/GumN family protein [Silanimonas algicola]
MAVRGAWQALVFVVATALAASVAAAPGPPRPLLWKASDGNNDVYLLGTFHLLEAGDYPLDPKVYAALDDAEQVFFELSPEALADPTLGVKFAQAGLRTDGRTLQQALDAPTWAATVQLATAAGLPIDALQRMEPWFAALTLSMAEMTAAGLDPALGLDKHLAQRATREGKRTAGLETPADQIRLFDGMKVGVQLAQLRDVVERSDEIRSETEWLHRQWREGDVDALYWGMAAAMKARDPALYERINTQRNAAWVSRIKALLDAPGDDDALVAVGSLHLLGAEGLVQQLAAAGYTVERL